MKKALRNRTSPALKTLRLLSVCRCFLSAITSCVAKAHVVFLSFKGKAPCAAADLTILESDTSASGRKHGWVKKQGDYSDYFLADTKNFVAAFMGVSKEEITQSAMDLAFAEKGEQSAIVGLCARVSVFENSNTPEFPHMSWSPYVEDSVDNDDDNVPF